MTLQMSDFLPREKELAPLTVRDDTILDAALWLEQEGYIPASTVLRAMVTRHEIVTLEEVKNNEGFRQDLLLQKGLKCRIWNGMYMAYWRPNGAGYTRTALNAGIYTIQEAYEWTSHVGEEKQIAYEMLPDSAIRLSLASSG